jgi:hypothetical protein
MSEKTDIVERLRDWESVSASLPGSTLMLLHNEAADEIDSLRFELQTARDERDEARAESSCAHDQVKQLQNEVRW